MDFTRRSLRDLFALVAVAGLAALPGVTLAKPRTPLPTPPLPPDQDTSSSTTHVPGPRGLVVVRRGLPQGTVRRFFPNWRVAHPTEALTGHVFPRIVVTFEPTRDESIWLTESVFTRIRPGGVIEWVSLEIV